MKRFLFLILIMLAIAGSLPGGTVTALEKVADKTAVLTSLPDKPTDSRAIKLEAFLSSYNSPLADKAPVFVREADRYGLDYRWVAMILGVESTFGKHIPPGSYNGWGWGIPTGAKSGIGFTSWEHGISEVTKGLAIRYVARGLTTIEKIGPVYAASPAWSTKVNFFLAKYEAFEVRDPQTLDVTL